MELYAIEQSTPTQFGVERRRTSHINNFRILAPSTYINRRIVLNSRPNGAPTLDNFRSEEKAIPNIVAGQILLRTIYLSLDPYMRGRMNEGPSYAPPIAIGDVMGGATVAQVQESQHPDFKVGDLVLSYNGWQNFAISDGKGITKLSSTLPRPSFSLGVLGMPGFTAYMGLLDIGKPQVGETVVVAAASGAVGSVVGQIAKLKGCRVVGIAGSDEKCRYVTEELGFDACINRHSSELPKELAAACLHGIDVYFENVGGAVFDAVLPLLNVHARVPLCGMISHYNDTNLAKNADSNIESNIESNTQSATNNTTQNHRNVESLTRTLLTKRIKIQGFIIFDDYGSHFDAFFTQMSEWINQGKIKYREDIVNGLENAPEAFIGLLEGKNFGKLVVHVGS